MNTVTNCTVLFIAKFISNVICKEKHKVYDYFILLLFGAAITFATDNLYGKDEIKFIRYLTDSEIKCVLMHTNPKDLTLEQRQFYMAKMDFHEQNARRCYEDAKNSCWWLPNIEHRDLARNCFVSIGALCSPGTPQSKIVAALISLMISYGLNCMDEWDYINNKLYWSEYHWDMYEFYCNVLVNG